MQRGVNESQQWLFRQLRVARAIFLSRLNECLAVCFHLANRVKSALDFLIWFALCVYLLVTVGAVSYWNHINIPEPDMFA